MSTGKQHRVWEKKRQNSSIPYAWKHREPWTMADDDLVMDTHLSPEEKELLLHRTFYGIKCRINYLNKMDKENSSLLASMLDRKTAYPVGTEWKL